MRTLLGGETHDTRRALQIVGSSNERAARFYTGKGTAANAGQFKFDDQAAISITAGAYQCNSCSLAPAGEVPQLNSTAKDSVAWTAASNASYYHLYRGTSADLPKLLDASADSCDRGVTAGLAMSGLTEVPAPSGLQWFLVRGGDGGGLGSAGNATGGPRVHDSSGVCP